MNLYRLPTCTGVDQVGRFCTAHTSVLIYMYGIGSWKNWLNIHITEAAMTLEQASAKAKEESRNGYVQHVCRRVESLTPYVVFYIVSDWYDSSTVVSFECGREL